MAIARLRLPIIENWEYVVRGDISAQMAARNIANRLDALAHFHGQNLDGDAYAILARQFARIAEDEDLLNDDAENALRELCGHIIE